ncbi:hypothetical protein CTA1_3985 [Colletotrichum tanaceti]|uniref:Uncharacterized protein n=1 Tax=Colletotrichum tanaceti TaxID=1306861 RepID=A0A4U6XKC5_9PEZI|nr:hypothetical protein CTA1_3985 [Colletotrichum tanaceti]
MAQHLHCYRQLQIYEVVLLSSQRDLRNALSSRLITPHHVPSHLISSRLVTQTSKRPEESNHPSVHISHPTVPFISTMCFFFVSASTLPSTAPRPEHDYRYQYTGHVHPSPRLSLEPRVEVRVVYHPDPLKVQVSDAGYGLRALAQTSMFPRTESLLVGRCSRNLAETHLFRLESTWSGYTVTEDTDFPCGPENIY